MATETGNNTGMLYIPGEEESSKSPNTPQMSRRVFLTIVRNATFAFFAGFSGLEDLTIKPPPIGPPINTLSDRESLQRTTIESIPSTISVVGLSTETIGLLQSGELGVDFLQASSTEFERMLIATEMILQSLVLNGDPVVQLSPRNLDNMIIEVNGSYDEDSSDLQFSFVVKDRESGHSWVVNGIDEDEVNSIRIPPNLNGETYSFSVQLIRDEQNRQMHVGIMQDESGNPALIMATDGTNWGFSRLQNNILQFEDTQVKTETRLRPSLVRRTGTRINVREAPGNENDDIGDLTAGDHLLIYIGRRVIANGEEWIALHGDFDPNVTSVEQTFVHGLGWVRSDLVEFVDTANVVESEASANAELVANARRLREHDSQGPEIPISRVSIRYETGVSRLEPRYDIYPIIAGPITSRQISIYNYQTETNENKEVYVIPILLETQNGQYVRSLAYCDSRVVTAAFTQGVVIPSGQGSARAIASSEINDELNLHPGDQIRLSLLVIDPDDRNRFIAEKSMTTPLRDESGQIIEENRVRWENISMYVGLSQNGEQLTQNTSGTNLRITNVPSILGTAIEIGYTR